MASLTLMTRRGGLGESSALAVSLQLYIFLVLVKQGPAAAFSQPFSCTILIEWQLHEWNVLAEVLLSFSLCSIRKIHRIARAQTFFLEQLEASGLAIFPHARLTSWCLECRAAFRWPAFQSLAE